MTGKIFINYRRGEDAQAAGRIFDRLRDVFGPEQLFLDIDNIAPGLDFTRVLDERVSESDVVLAVIGRNWIDARHASGTRRLDDHNDFVRIELTSALNQGKRVIPVLVGDAQMPRPEDLPDVLRPLARRNAVRLTHERFHSDVQGLIKSLREGLKEIEAQREAETAERVAAERQRREAEARLRAQAERAFEVAKRAGTVLALDNFLSTHGTSALADQARTLRTVLVAREGAYRDAATSDDPAVLRSFIATYSKGADVDHARRRLRGLKAQHGWRPSAGIMIAVALALALTGGAGAYWFAVERQPSATIKSGPAVATVPPVPSQQAIVSPTPDQAAWDLLKDTSDVNALKRFIAEYPTSPLRSQAEARIATLEKAQPAKPASPRPDELAWQLLKDTTDEAALKQFVAQYPDSPLRKDAEARIAALEAARAAKPPPPRPDEVAWSFLKDTRDADELKRFIAQYPDSPLRKDAEARLTTLEAEAAWNKVKDSNDPDELRRFVEQYPNSAQRADAEKRIASLAEHPLVCPHGEHAKGRACVANEPRPTKQAKRSGPDREPTPVATAPKPDSGCPHMVDREAFNGVSGMPGCR